MINSEKLLIFLNKIPHMPLNFFLQFLRNLLQYTVCVLPVINMRRSQEMRSFWSPGEIGVTLNILHIIINLKYNVQRYDTENYKNTITVTMSLHRPSSQHLKGIQTQTPIILTFICLLVGFGGRTSSLYINWKKNVPLTKFTLKSTSIMLTRETAAARHA